MLRQCLDSIRALLLRPSEREIIIIDDGSTTPVIGQLADYQDEIIYIRKPNGGVSSARNTGLRMATGNYIQFIDGDDMFIQGPYEHVLDLVRYGHADLVMYDFSETPQATAGYEDIGPMSGAELLRKHNIHGSVWGLIFSRANLGTLRFTPGIAYGEDEEFTPQLLLRSEHVYQTTAKAYYYRERPGSAIHTNDLRNRLRRLNDAKDVIIRLQQKADTMPTEEKIAMQRRTAQLTMDYIYNVIVLTQNRKYLDKQLEQLHQQGLFPLPDRDYTKKYKWFRYMTSNEIGLRMLIRTLPLLKRER
jgi:glycosyltransferase involved in cell wall biosynthesis